MRLAVPVLLVASLMGARIASADPTPREAVISAADAATAPLWARVGGDSLRVAGGNVGLRRPLSLGLFGGSTFLSGQFSMMSSRLTLRPPAILGVQPLLAVGYTQLLTGPTGFAEIGASYDGGPLHIGWHLHLAERFDAAGGLPLVTSTGYARYVMPRWDFGIDHVAQLALWGSAFRRDLQFLTVSAGMKPAADAPTFRAGTTLPLRPVAMPSTRLSMFGTF